MRVVLDTGILIAALITSGTPPDAIYRAWRKKRFELISSEWQLDEFRRVSRYPKLRTYLKSADAGNLVNGLRREATVLAQLPTVDLSPDPNDNPVLAMALAARADVLVTGDRRDLLALGTTGSTRILSARQFVDELKISTDG
jgi:putative PIN family toxin of toxin-antitoxin system